jgi:hypothetical protein
MPNERAILCGSVADGSLPFEDANPLRLRMWGSHRNVHLTIEDVREAMVKEVPSVLLDLIDIAVYVYCADQATTRGGDGVQDFGENWRRRFFFRIPVRTPEAWKARAVLDQLVSTLSFLSEDEYHFEFEPLTKEPTLQRYLDFNTTPYSGIAEEVVMFSGGLDSLGGAVQEAIIDKRKVVLVNHRSTSKLAPRHRYLLRLLNEQAKDTAPIHIPVRINKKKALGREYTQRTRSFLYASLGATIATMLGLNKMRFYENGVVSLNLPPSAQVVGSRATRTTHPQFLNGFSKLLTELAGKTFTVENPFIWKTKTDVLRLIADAGCGGLLKYATSCTHTWEMTKQHTHCGTCSQCIDRRFAVLAAGQDANDPGEAYKVDLLVGERKEGDPRTMLAEYVETANEIEKMAAVQFFGKYGEASRVLRHIGGNADATAMQIYDLHRKHAKQITGVVDQALAKHAAAIRKRELPPSCLLRLVADSSAAGGDGTPAGKKHVQNSQLPLGDNAFRKKGQVWELRFAGGPEYILLPTKGAAYLHLLVSRPGTALSAVDLACQVAKNPDRFALGDAGEQSDGEALSAYRARVIELREEVEEAKTNNDAGAQTRAQQELDCLTEQIRKDQGLGTRLRKAVDDRERVRKAVGNAIKRALQDIAQFDQRIADHFKSPRLKCGQSPCYLSDQGVQWDT